MKKRLLIVFLIIAVAGLGWGWSYYVRQPADLSWQGWIEGDFLFVGPDEAGRLTTLLVKEGASVKHGDRLFAVQNDIQAAEMQQAEATLSEAEARLSKALAAQQRPEEIAVLESQKTRAAAALEKSRPELARAQDLVAKGTAPQSRLDDAAAVFAGDQASLAAAQQQIEVARLKARDEDIEAARAVVEQAHSRLSAARVSLDRRAVVAPADSVVQEIFFRQGEVVSAGRAVVSLLPPGNVKLRFYVSEPQLAGMSPGQKVQATCDGCGTPIQATVSFISTEAEYTPPVIFSREERAKLVFRVDALPQDSNKHLRVGLPITVEPVPQDVANAEPKHQ